MNVFPTRKENANLPEVMLRYSENDLFLFIEDEKMGFIYKKLVDRLVDGKLKIGKIHSLKSKRNVLRTFNEWKKEKYFDKCFFIVDKDFDHFKDLEIPHHSNLIELEKYTLENYLVTKEGAISLLKLKVFNKEDYELEALLDWTNWISNINNSFKALFIVYAISFKYTLCKNTSISPGRYFKESTYEINNIEINKYIEQIKDLCESENIDFQEEYSKIEDFYNDVDGFNYSGLIKGKYLSFGLFKYLNKTFNKKFDEEFSYYTMADNINLESLDFMKKKLFKQII
ncbi:DUF4435 domain-containing protein [Bacillus pumilus]|uniref:DUF4435 domain-containing protein n=1 Tax=Bacillus pumilus TaxID=1408 RepID=UPI00119D1B76|nr:DUF4435 domain-containing protein [Bacillus pumilus]